MKRTSIALFRIAMFVSAIALTARLSAAEPPAPEADTQRHASHVSSTSSAFVAKVREATEAFRQTIPAGYQQFLGCVSGPDQGAMGVHFVNFALLDAEFKVDQPEALIYEVKDGRARLVGVEYIIPAEAWDAAHPAQPLTPPIIEGQLFQFTDSPNRFRLPAFYELHVWAWRDNPNGTFADWNPRVSCDGF